MLFDMELNLLYKLMLLNFPCYYVFVFKSVKITNAKLLGRLVAHLRVSKLPLDHPKGMLHLGPDAGLALLHLVHECVYGVFFLVQLFALAWAHRHMPGDILPGIRALVCALVASIPKGIRFLTMEQAVAFSDVGHVARGANDGVHQA